MLRQTSCEYQHEFTRTPVIEVERRGNDKVLIHYDVYFCESCGYTFKILTEIAEVKDYYKWM